MKNFIVRLLLFLITFLIVWLIRDEQIIKALLLSYIITWILEPLLLELL